MDEGGIVRYLNTPDQMLEKLKEPDDVSEFLSELQTLEKLLKLANIFNERARKYAELEAATYKRIIELGFEESVPARQHQDEIVSWFGNLPQDEQDRIVTECGEEGITIKAVWKREVQQPRKEAQELADAMDYCDRAFETFKHEGKVELDWYFNKIDQVGKHLRSDVIKGCKDKTRERIRDAGGHGLGDGAGTYLSTEYAWGNTRNIIDNKIKSVMRDLQRLMQFMDDCGIDVQLDLKTETNFTDNLSLYSSVCIALLSLGYGTPELHTDDLYKRTRLCTNLLWNVFNVTPYEFFNMISKCCTSEYIPAQLEMFGWPEHSDDGRGDDIHGQDS